MIVAIASGKGGTGKTLVATSIALSLARLDKVQLLDCDVEEPNAHVLLKPVFTYSEEVAVPIPCVDKKKCTLCGKCAEVCAFNAIMVVKESVLVFDELCHGCGSCSYLCPEKAIGEGGRVVGVIEIGKAGNIELVHGKLSIGEAMAPPLIRGVKGYLNRGSTVIIDVPPGTSCPVVEAVKGSDYCILVTEPTPFGFSDLVMMVGVVRDLGIPHGVIINRAGLGDESVETYCIKENIPLLMKIPLDIEIARLYSRGVTLAEGFPRWQGKLLGLFERIAKGSNE